MSTWCRYLVFQIPEWLITGVIALALWRWQIVPLWLSAIGVVAWVIKDLVLYRYVRSAFERDHRVGAALLIGHKGIASGKLAPNGYVRVRGELWRAVARQDEPEIAAGTMVEIVAADGMEVVVRPITKQ